MKGIKTEANTAPTFQLKTTSDYTSIAYTVETLNSDDILCTLKVELLKDDQVVKDNGALLSGIFENLLSNNSYTIRFSYTYDLNDGQGEMSKNVTKIIQTDKKIAPNIMFGKISADYDSISYVAEVLDTNGIFKEITKVELLNDENIIAQGDPTLSGKFEGLLSNTAYTLRISYTYDLNDGRGLIEKTVEKEIKTLAKTVPKIAFAGISVTDTAVNGKINMTDPDAIGMLLSVALYKNGGLIKESRSKEFRFEGLDGYTDYQIIATYTYDLNTGKGLQTATASYSFKTDPTLTLKSCVVANTAAVSEGETIILRATLENPFGAVPSEVTVNGKFYSCASSGNMFYVEIVNSGQFEGGETVLTIEKVRFQLDGKNYTVSITENNSASVFINGVFEVLSLQLGSLENGKFVEKDYIFPCEQAYLMLTLSNKTGYGIDRINLTENRNYTEYTELIRVDDEHYLVKILTSAGCNSIALTDLKYSGGNFSKELNDLEIISNTLFNVLSDEIKYISSPEDLLNMDEGYYYELTGDIDLSGREWIGKEFYGVFDGKGYTIQNMSRVGDIAQDLYIGLFTRGAGVLKNIHLSKVTIIISVKDDHAISCGALVGAACYKREPLIIDNCHVDSDSFIVVSNANKERSYIGGLVGETKYSVWSSGHEIVNIIKNCTNKARVEGSGKVGGIAGTADYVIASANFGSVDSYSSYYQGGIASEAELILNCYNVGEVNGATNDLASPAGALIRNSYSFDSATTVHDGNWIEFGPPFLPTRSQNTIRKNTTQRCSVGTKRSGILTISMWKTESIRR